MPLFVIKTSMFCKACTKEAKEDQQEILLNLQGGHLAAVIGAPFEGLQLNPHGHDLADLDRTILEPSV